MLLNVSYISDEASVIGLEIGSEIITLGESSQSSLTETVTVIQEAIRIVKDTLVVIRYQ